MPPNFQLYVEILQHVFLRQVFEVVALVRDPGLGQLCRVQVDVILCHVEHVCHAQLFQVPENSKLLMLKSYFAQV